MRHRLAISALGSLEVAISGHAQPAPGGGKMWALLVYLAMQPGYRHAREALAELFWPDLPSVSARFNLRHTVFRLRETLGCGDGDSRILLSGRDWLAMNPRGDIWLDVSEFTASASGQSTWTLGEGERLSNLYRGELLAGFSLPSCQEFEHWLQARREELRRRAIDLLEYLAQQYEDNGNFDRALFFAQRLSSINPLNEASHCRIMRLCALAGRPAAAIAQYEACQTIVEKELGVQSTDASRLHEQIVGGLTPQTDGSDRPDAAAPNSRTNSANRVRILMVDDHAMFRTGLRLLLQANLNGIEIVEAGSVEEALRISGAAPWIVLLDIKLPGVNGIDGIAAIKARWATTRIIVLSYRSGHDTSELAIRSGAAGFVCKSESSEKVMSAIRRLLPQGNGLNGESSAQSDAEVDKKRMTPRQSEVLELMCAGLSSKLIARQLMLSESTVRAHTQEIFWRLKASCRTEAVATARRLRLVGCGK